MARHVPHLGSQRRPTSTCSSQGALLHTLPTKSRVPGRAHQPRPDPVAALISLATSLPVSLLARQHGRGEEKKKARHSSS
ncbi:hypothetical protein IF2G_04534 [Cordyceps javanica]|nr:hypothetical protein IF2G_04534 [Cordyceps javanica]